MEPTEWAWLAGLFEGEGTIAFDPKSTNVQIRIGMTDADVIETVQRLFPGRRIRRELKHRDKPLYQWSVATRNECLEFLENVLPYLHSRRRARAEEALERLARNHGAKHLRTHCIYGHPLSGENLYIARTTGARSCRVCRRRRDLERRERRKAAR